MSTLSTDNGWTDRNRDCCVNTVDEKLLRLRIWWSFVKERCHSNLFSISCGLNYFQCFGTVVWVTGRDGIGPVSVKTLRQSFPKLYFGTRGGRYNLYKATGLTHVHLRTAVRVYCLIAAEQTAFNLRLILRFFAIRYRLQRSVWNFVWRSWPFFHIRRCKNGTGTCRPRWPVLCHRGKLGWNWSVDAGDSGKVPCLSVVT